MSRARNKAGNNARAARDLDSILAEVCREITTHCAQQEHGPRELDIHQDIEAQTTFTSSDVIAAGSSQAESIQAFEHCFAVVLSQVAQLIYLLEYEPVRPLRSEEPRRRGAATEVHSGTDPDDD